MRDPYAGHRSDHVWWVPDAVRDTQWTEWDYVLLEACETIKILQSPQSGQLRNLSEDPDVYWEVDFRVDYGAQELHEATKDKEPDPGVTLFLTNPKKRDDAPFWSVSEWLEDIEKGSPKIERDAPDGARMPTPDDLAELQARRRRVLEEGQQ